MSAAAILALMGKDLRLYFANRFFALVTVLGLVVYIAVYFLLPSSVDDSLALGLAIPAAPPALEAQLQGGEARIVRYADDAALRAAVLAGEVPVGFAYPADLAERLRAGEQVAVSLYLAPAVPIELTSIYEAAVREFTFALLGQDLAIEVREEVLGADMAGAQIAPRQRLLPVVALLVLMVECLGLASLIAAEVEAGTIRALLVTPLTMRGLFLAKGIFGTLFAFAQAALLLAITGGLAREPLLNLAALLCGAALVTGVAFLIASVGRDLMSVMGWGILALLLMALPALNLLLPGLAASWINLVPTYYLVDTINRSLNYGAGWAELGMNLPPLLASAALLLGLGAAVLQRRFS